MPYPPLPGKRIAYDLDGTVVMASVVIPELPNISSIDFVKPAKTAMNSERNTGDSTAMSIGKNSANLTYDSLWQGADPLDMQNGAFIVFIFPVPTRISGALVLCQSISVTASSPGRGDPSPMSIATSQNSTSGFDGDWEVIGTGLDSRSPKGTGSIHDSTCIVPDGTRPGGRNGVAIPTLNDVYRRRFSDGDGGFFEFSGSGTRNVRALKVFPATGSRARIERIAPKIHLYGEPDTAATEDRLSFWKTNTSEPVSSDWFDWGNVPLSSTAEKRFRVRNMSTSRTAVGVLLDALPGASIGEPQPDTFLTFSIDGGITWSAAENIPAISPGTVSPEIRVRRVIPSNAQLSNWAPRVVAEVEKWE